MNCKQVSEGLYPYTKGWLDEAEERTIRTHLDSCPSCSSEIESIQAALAPLAQVDEIRPSPRVWEHISSAIDVAVAPRPMRWGIGVAAAASILVAVLSFIILFASSNIAATVSELGSDYKGGLRVGQALEVGTTLTTPTYAKLTLPDVGTLKLNHDTKIEFRSARHVVLLEGELFADIEPNGRGFAVESNGATATVTGTRFGMRSGGLVYVVEGRVELAAPGGRLELAAGEAAVGARRERPESVSQYAEWIGAYERPHLLVEAKPGEKAWTVTLSTNSPAPVFLSNFRESPSPLFVRIERGGDLVYSGQLDPEAVAVRDALGGPDGLLRLDTARPCVLEVKLERGLFRAGPGAYRVSIGYLGAPDLQHPRLWHGTAQSLPETVEVSR